MRIISLLIGLTVVMASPQILAQQVIALWGQEAPPFSKPNNLEEYEAPCWEATCVYQVVNPTLTLYKPEGPGNGNAVIVLPGGGYEAEAIYYEGHEIAQALARRGTTAAVLKYRLPNPETATQPEQVPLSDVRQALSLLRKNQTQYKFSATRFGLLGFSAGSHLATVAGVHRATDPSRNPDFSILVYGVTKLTKENQEWLEKTLYHRAMTPGEISEQRLLEHINETTPTAFLVHALDDDVCHYTESTLYAEALSRAGVDTELHLFARGGHGFGAGRKEDGTGQWLELAGNWLDRMGTPSSDL